MTNVSTQSIESPQLGCASNFFIIDPRATSTNARAVADDLMEQIRATIAVLQDCHTDLSDDNTLSRLNASSCIWSIQTQLELAQKAYHHAFFKVDSQLDQALHSEEKAK